MQPPGSGTWQGIRTNVSGLRCQRLPVRPRSSCFDSCLQQDRSDAADAFVEPAAGPANKSKVVLVVCRVSYVIQHGGKEISVLGGWLVGKC